LGPLSDRRAERADFQPEIGGSIEARLGDADAVAGVYQINQLADSTI
jgi:hypothetical protein